MGKIYGAGAGDIARGKDVFLKMLGESRRVVFFGGAGVSTESGVPDFRSVDGLYNQKYDYPPEEILSHDFFERKTEEFYRFYREKILIGGAKPNVTHLALKKLEDAGKLTAVVTQNIDGLHEAAGSRKIFNLHGTSADNHCVKCGRYYSVADVLKTEGVPRCECGGVIKPDVVLYGEMLPDGAVVGAKEAIERADMLIVGGTSLSVYPAAGFVNFYKGDKLVLINLQPTPYDDRADLVLRCRLGEIFGAVEGSL